MIQAHVNLQVLLYFDIEINILIKIYKELAQPENCPFIKLYVLNKSTPTLYKTKNLVQWTIYFFTYFVRISLVCRYIIYYCMNNNMDIRRTWDTLPLSIIMFPVILF